MLSPLTPNRNGYRQALNRMGWAMMLFVGVIYACVFATEFLYLFVEDMAKGVFLKLLPIFEGALYSVSYMLPFFITGVFYLFLSRKSRTERMWLAPRFTPEFPLLIIAGLGVITVASYLNSWFCALIGYSMPPEIILPESYENPATVINYMTTALAPAFAEEFLFRGVIYTNLRPYGRTRAILISALLFALMHQNIAQIFYTFAAGIAMALMYELTGSIWCSVIYHAINNELAVVAEVLIYGKIGDAAYTAMLFWDLAICLLGAAATVILIFHYRKKRRLGGDRPQGSTSMDYSGEALPVGDGLPRGGRQNRREAFAGLLCPGIVAFTVTTVVLMLLTWLSFLLNG